MSQHRVSLIIAVVSCTSIVVAAQQFHKRLLATEKEHILDGPFTMVKTTDAMPANLKQAFAEITGAPSFALANPGERYQVTDVVIDRKLPLRRLVFAGAEADEWFIHYERGGRGHSFSVLVFKVDKQNRVQFVWGGVGTHGAKNLEQLRKMVAAGRFSDEIENYW